MKICLVSGAYRAPSQWEVASNIETARQAAGRLCRRGIFPITPHLNTAYFESLQPDDFWLKGYLEILRRCDMIYVLANYRTSSGALAELAEAKRLGLQVVFEEEENNASVR